jgi:hypothetical protein
MMTTLETLRDALSAIEGVASCKIGLEANISPADYPLIRVVPSRVQDDVTLGRRMAECLVYFGVDVSEAEGGLEDVYTALFDLEAQVRAAIAQAGGLYRETITDEDRLETYKVMAVRCEVVG